MFSFHKNLIIKIFIRVTPRFADRCFGRFLGWGLAFGKDGGKVG